MEAGTIIKSTNCSRGGMLKILFVGKDENGYSIQLVLLNQLHQFHSCLFETLLV